MTTDWPRLYSLWEQQDDVNKREFAARYGVNYNTLRREFAARAKPQPTITQISQYIPTDTDRWREWLAWAQAQPRLRVSHACDMHDPYRDTAAVNLYLRCVEVFKPHIVVVGSDAFDFPQISSFVRNPDMASDDVLDAVRPYWQNFIGRLRCVAPLAVFVFIFGNHEKRLMRFVQEQAPQVRKTLLRAFVDVIQCGGEVLYLGEIEQLEIDCLTVAHGNRRTKTLRKYGAAGQLDYVRYQRHITTGHAHRIQSHCIRGPERIVESAVSGCLCRLDQHYLNEGDYNEWLQGSTFWTLRTGHGVAWQHNLKYERVGGNLETAFGPYDLSVPLSEDVARLEPTPLDELEAA